jgi:hypothetical protein
MQKLPIISAESAFLCIFAILFATLALAGSNQAEPKCSVPGSVTHLSRGNGGQALCWKRNGIRLIGYSAFDAITSVALHDVGTTPDVGFTSTVPNASYMGTLKFIQDDAANRAANHGVNYSRILVFGNSCAVSADPCTNFSGRERMPFRNLRKSGPPNYDVRFCPPGEQCICPGGPGCLDETYKQWLIDTLSEADKNGIIVELSLFDGFYMRDRYGNNPWNPLWNNLDSTKVCGGNTLPKTKNPFPEFYQICTTGQDPCPSSATDESKNKLTCLGKVENNFVDQIVDIVKTGNPDPQSHGNFKNVFFEVMEEAPSQTTGKPHSNPAVFAQWHNTVGAWIRAKGRYLVAAGIYPDPKSFWNECTVGNCTNNFRVFKEKYINVVTLHASTWYNDPCGYATKTLAKFHKAVIISDDGTPTSSERNDPLKILGWAQTATLGSCRDVLGEVHFEHLDGDRMRTKKAKGCKTNDLCVDCAALDKLGEVPPSPCLPGPQGCAPDSYVSKYCPF